MTEIGFVIQPGQPIPDDVTGVDDKGHDDWHLTSRSHWHCGEGGTRNCERNPDCTSGGEPTVYAPLTVTAVREQPAEPEPVSTQLYWSVGTPAAIDGLKGVYTTEEAANAAKAEDSRLDVASIYLDRAYPVFPAWDPDTAPAPEPESVDVIEVVRLFGRAQYTTGYQISRGDQEKADRAVNDGGELFARIEAEVNRLRAEVDATGFLASVNKLTIEREDARAQVRRLNAEAERVTDELVKAREERDLARKSRDEHHNRLEAIKGELANAGYASPDAEPIWIGSAVHRLVELAESLQAAEAQQHEPASPLVLRLPEVPEGAVALVGASGHRFERDGGRQWRGPAGFIWSLGGMLEHHAPLTVVMAPPREPRTWPKLDGTPEDLHTVELTMPSGAVHTLVRRTDDRWALVLAGSNPEEIESYECLTWTEMLGEGEVREVFDDKDGTR